MYGKRIVNNIQRPKSDIIRRFALFSTPDLCDVMGGLDTMDHSIKPMVTTRKIIGPAFTIRVPGGDGGIIPSAIKMTQPGDIIVISCQSHCTSAYWGDQRSELAINNQVQGVIIDGAIRDIDDCEKLALPIYAKALTTCSSSKEGNGEVNVNISCGGVVVSPGDIIFADRNGVCVIPYDYAEEILEKLENNVLK